MRRIVSLFLLPLLLLGPGMLRAELVPPDRLVQGVADRVLESIRTDPRLKSGDRSAIFALAEKEVLPHFDFERMTRLAVGRPWRDASAAQRDELVAQFRTLLVRTYASALINYKDQAFSVDPVRLAGDATEATVHSAVHRSGGARPITIDYRMEKLADGWKVFDVAIENVSLVTNYRASFGAIIANSGIGGLIDELRRKNAENLVRNGTPS